MMRTLRFLPLLATFAVLPNTLAAQPTSDAAPPQGYQIDCDGFYRTAVTVDGLQTDWEDEARPAERIQQLVAGAAEYDWTGPADASFRVWCRFNETGLYFAIVGRDNAVVGADGRRAGDRLDFWFELGGGPVPANPVRITVPLGPAAEAGSSPPVWTWPRNRTGEVTGARAELSPRDNGFFAEVYLPYAGLQGLPRPFGAIPFVIAFRDWDYDAPREEEVIVSTGVVGDAVPTVWGTLAYNALAARMAHIRDRTPGGMALTPTLQTWGHLGGDAGPDLVFVLGDLLIVTGESLGDFAWTAMPLLRSDRETWVSLSLADLDGDGLDEILATVRRPIDAVEGAEGMTRDVLEVLKLDGETLRTVFVQEVALRHPSGWVLETSLERVAAVRRIPAHLRFAAATGERPRNLPPGLRDEVGRTTPMVLPGDGARAVVWEIGEGPWQFRTE